jgi:glycosyltransferase involved in cell wall biosynthesis
MVDPAMISIVIPAYNEEANIGSCLHSLANQTYTKPFQVIVVDNNSTDLTAQIAGQFRSLLKLTIINEPRKGRGQARHTGFNHALGNIIVSTDADAHLPPHWLSSLVEPLEDQANVVGITSPQQVSEFGPVKNWLLNRQDLLMIVFRLIFGHWGFIGLSFAVKKSVYEKVGGFNTAANIFEDIELSQRVAKQGTILFISKPRAVVSGRRYYRGLFAGLKPYIVAFVNMLLRRDYVTLALSDIRSSYKKAAPDSASLNTSFESQAVGSISDHIESN